MADATSEARLVRKLLSPTTANNEVMAGLLPSHFRPHVLAVQPQYTKLHK
jgi:hypothetical protein